MKRSRSGWSSIRTSRRKSFEFRVSSFEFRVSSFEVSTLRLDVVKTLKVRPLVPTDIWPQSALYHHADRWDSHLGLLPLSLPRLAGRADCGAGAGSQSGVLLRILPRRHFGLQ